MKFLNNISDHDKKKRVFAALEDQNTDEFEEFWDKADKKKDDKERKRKKTIDAALKAWRKKKKGKL
jgi:hypothetical protein